MSVSIQQIMFPIDTNEKIRLWSVQQSRSFRYRDTFFAASSIPIAFFIVQTEILKPEKMVLFWIVPVAFRMPL